MVRMLALSYGSLVSAAPIQPHLLVDGASGDPPAAHIV